MNEIKVTKLLKKWSIILDIGECQAKEKAKKAKNGLMGRIKRSTGQPVIFDFLTYEKQKELQDNLCLELPEWSDIIRSTPELMDGFFWIRGDFIELYFEYFRLVIEKLERIIEKQNAM